MTDKVRKTAKDKAQESLDAATRKYDRLSARRDKLAADLEKVTAEVDQAKAERDYIANHPALTQPTEVERPPQAVEPAVEPPQGVLPF